MSHLQNITGRGSGSRSLRVMCKFSKFQVTGITNKDAGVQIFSGCGLIQLLQSEHQLFCSLVVELGLHWDACRPAWDWLLFEAVLLWCSCGRSPALRLLAAAHPLPRVLVFPVQPWLVRSKDGNGRVRILLNPLQRLPQLRQEGWWGDLRTRME